MCRCATIPSHFIVQPKTCCYSPSLWLFALWMHILLVLLVVAVADLTNSNSNEAGRGREIQDNNFAAASLVQCYYNSCGSKRKMKTAKKEMWNIAYIYYIMYIYIHILQRKCHGSRSFGSEKPQVLICIPWCLQILVASPSTYPERDSRPLKLM